MEETAGTPCCASLCFHCPISMTTKASVETRFSLLLWVLASLFLPGEPPIAPAYCPLAQPVAAASPAAYRALGAASGSPGWAGHSGSEPLVGWRPPRSCSCGSSGRPGPELPTGFGPWHSEPGSYLRRRERNVLRETAVSPSRLLPSLEQALLAVCTQHAFVYTSHRTLSAP